MEEFERRDKLNDEFFLELSYEKSSCVLDKVIYKLF